MQNDVIIMNVRSLVRFNVRFNVRSTVRPNVRVYNWNFQPFLSSCEIEIIHRSFTEASQKLQRSFREFPDHCSLKAIVYRIVFLSKLESFTGADMLRRFRWTCPVCGQITLAFRWRPWVNSRDTTGLSVASAIKSSRMVHRTKKRICVKFAWCKYVANMKFAKLCNQCKGGNGRICTKTGKFGHCHLCTGCKAFQILYLQHICTRQIWSKFNIIDR